MGENYFMLKTLQMFSLSRFELENLKQNWSFLSNLVNPWIENLSIKVNIFMKTRPYF